MQIVWPAATAFSKIGELIRNYRRGGVENLPLSGGGVLIELSGVETDPILSGAARMNSPASSPHSQLWSDSPRAGAG